MPSCGLLLACNGMLISRSRAPHKCSPASPRLAHSAPAPVAALEAPPPPAPARPPAASPPASPSASSCSPSMPHPTRLLYARPHTAPRRDPIAALRARQHSGAFPVPPYLPLPARALLPLPLADCWDEAVTALLRAAIHFRPGPGSFHAYAQVAIRRGLWRYCRRPSHPTTISLDAVPPSPLPDVETLLIALEDGAALTSAAAYTATPPAAHRAPG